MLERMARLLRAGAERRLDGLYGELRDVQARRCAAEVQFARDGQEIAQQPGIEIHSRKLSLAGAMGLGRATPRVA